jgi:transmembrane sensor
MSHQPEFIANLIYAYLNNTLTPEEEAELQQWLQSSPGNAVYFASVVEKIRSKELSKEYLSSDDEKIWNKITEQVPGLLEPASPAIVAPLRPMRFRKIAIAAAVVAVAAFGTWFVFMNNKTDHSTSIAGNAVDDVMPGGDKAVLILADGKKIFLDTTRNGQTVMQASVKIVQTEKGKLEYHTIDGAKEMAATMYNTIVVPAGGRFRLELPDGSQVWLNAKSSLRYPIVFNGSSRNVELKGEGYFEVAKMMSNKKERVPFNVVVQRADGEAISNIEVLGTRFNVSAYDSLLRTTLTEGKVKVSSKSGATALLSPGQQSIQEGSAALTVADHADTEQAIAWVSGWFNFNNATIREIMEEAARWYSLKVIYQGGITDKHFSLNLPRDIPISKMLQVLQMTGSIKFNIDKATNTITVQQ